MDLGYPPTADAPEIHAIILEALNRIHASEKASGILTLDKEFMAQCLEHKASFVAVGIDVLVLANGLRMLAADARKIADIRCTIS